MPRVITALQVQLAPRPTPLLMSGHLRKTSSATSLNIVLSNLPQLYPVLQELSSSTKCKDSASTAHQDISVTTLRRSPT